MGGHYLEKAFNPKTIAVIGASDRPGSVGAIVMNNLVQDGFTGRVFPVNPKHKEVHGKPCVATIREINADIDLAIIVTPADTVPDVLQQCGEQKIRSALILSAGFAEIGSEGSQRQKSLLEISRQYQIRIIGPNCLGIMRPAIKLNATFSNVGALPGNLALVSQSGAICVAILDWAIEKGIGFSAIASLGNTVNVDFGDILDYLALDTSTSSILLYIESIRNARHFMSGLRAASRLKPIIVIKVGRYAQGSRAAVSHTGAQMGNDDVFDIALHRGGAVRVNRIEQLFDAAEILSSNYQVKGDRLAILTNGGGAAVMSADHAAQLHISTPNFDPMTMARLNEILPKSWSHQNPIDILGDATPKRYQDAITACLQDNNVDGLLTILVPVTMSEPEKVAAEVINAAKHTNKPILACWMGQQQVQSSWQLFSDNHLPYFNTPESAVEAFSYLANYHLNQQLLLQIPDPLSYQIKPDVNAARLIIEAALAEKRKILTVIESKAILIAFGIPVTQSLVAQTANEALNLAKSLGFPVVMKILSPDISHKQEVGGVQLNITNAETVPQIFNEMIERAKQKEPRAKILGVTLERMYKNPNDRELMIGMLQDKIFGPVISFGAGGSLVEVMQDRALALPPLNQFIVKRLITQTRSAKLLSAFRNMPAANLEAIENILLRVSEMVCELPHIKEMDINPLVANENEAIALDARMVVDYPATSHVPYSHMAIHPYPRYLVREWQLTDGTPITIRPICPEDVKLEEDFISHLSEHSKYLRFWGHFRELTPEMLIRFTQIDYDREMALIATHQENNNERCIAITRYAMNPDQESCEFAIIVTDEWQNKGVGSYLLRRLMDVAKSKNIKYFVGEVLANNIDMLTMVRNLGFNIQNSDDPCAKIVVANLIDI
jgi:acetyltransferase